MDNDETKTNNTNHTAEQAPADALSRDPDDLASDSTAVAIDEIAAAGMKSAVKAKKQSKFKKLLKAINIYLLLFILLLIVAGAFAVVNYLNSRKAEPVAPSIANQTLTQDSLDKLAKSDVSVGASNQTFTVKGNADIAGQTLLRGNLNVAGTMQSAGALTAPSLTVAGKTNLRETQVQSLQSAGSITVRGDATIQKLSVTGSSSFKGAVTAGRITTSDLVLSGNATLTIPNHISFAGPSPGRSVSQGVVGGGGSASVDGTDAAGTVNISTGGGPSSGCMVRVSFNKSYPKTPRVVVTPVGANGGRLNFYVTRDNSGFDICSTNAPAGHSQFSFDYFVTN